MKISVSLSADDLEFVDEQTETGHFPSRSAAIHAAIRLWRDRELSDSYLAAWDEWAAEDGADWDRTISDAL